MQDQYTITVRQEHFDKAVADKSRGSSVSCVCPLAQALREQTDNKNWAVSGSGSGKVICYDRVGLRTQYIVDLNGRDIINKFDSRTDYTLDKPIEVTITKAAQQVYDGIQQQWY